MSEITKLSFGTKGDGVTVYLEVFVPSSSVPQPEEVEDQKRYQVAKAAVEKDVIGLLPPLMCRYSRTVMLP